MSHATNHPVARRAITLVIIILGCILGMITLSWGTPVAPETCLIICEKSAIVKWPKSADKRSESPGFANSSPMHHVASLDKGYK